MRNSKLVLIFVALMGLTFSCQDAYDMKQPGEVNNPDEVYNNVNDLKRGALGVYGAWTPITEIEFNSVFTDEVAIGRNNGGQGINDGMYTFILQAGSDAPAAIWGNNYAIINFANRILAAAERIVPADPAEIDPLDTDALTVATREKLEYLRVIAEMKAIRAYAHFNLLSYFSEDLTNDSAPGVMLLDFVPDYNYETQLPRSTNGEVFTFIEQDLTEVNDFFVNNLDDIDVYVTNAEDPDDRENWITPKDRISPFFVYALRARMNIYRERYSDALAYASTFVSGGNTAANSQYPLLSSPTTWASMLANANDGEVIFKLRQITGDPEVGALFNSQSSSINGSPFYELSRSLYNLYSNGDIRRGPGIGTNIIDATSIVATDYESIGDYRGGDVLVINKYPGNTAQGSNLLNDFMIFRTGEMFLIKAEALVGLGQLNDAAATMRALRRARFANVQQPLPNYTTATAAWADILTERRRELALEGHRWLDIKRLGEKAGGLGVERYIRDCEFYNACTLEPTSYKFTLPIPTSEIIANQNIAGQQNSGY